MIDKISLIRQILETDEETDIKILAILEKAKEKTKDTKILIEERLAERKDIVLDADLNSGKERIYAETENISTAGAFVRTEKKIAKGEELAIKLINPAGEEFGFVAEVMRVNPHGIGVMIKKISNTNEVKLTKFVDQF